MRALTAWSGISSAATRCTASAPICARRWRPPTKAYVLRVPSNFAITLVGGVTLTCAETIRWLDGCLRWEVRSAGAGSGSKGQR